jgi:hypothetical protein
VDLVQDKTAQGGQNLPAPGIKEQDAKTFRGSNKDGRGMPVKTPPLRLGGIPGAGLHGNRGKVRPRLLKMAAKPRQRLQQVPPYILVQGLKGGNVEDR